MTPPPFEVADVIRRAGSKFRDSVTGAYLKVLNAITHCRTAALGGHRDRCAGCGYETISYNSCRNRHCPKCQVNSREKWLRNRRQELLPVGYFHIVFSVPHSLIPLLWQNKKRLFSLMFQAAGSALLETAADPKYLGAEIGFLCILHTWGQTLQRHPHIHCVVPAGGLSPDHTRWISSHPRFLLPVKVLSSVFRGKFVEGLKQTYGAGKLRFLGDCAELNTPEAFTALLEKVSSQDWVVYSKPPFGGAEHVLQYLARYTHRVAISNHRILSVDEDHVTFRWKDYAHDNQQRTMSLSLEEFLHRFLQHVLPKGLPRIRYYGWLATRRRGQLLPLCRELLHSEAPLTVSEDSYVEHCPRCGGEMGVVERFARGPSFDLSHRIEYAVNSS